jgi:hypothetical protein
LPTALTSTALGTLGVDAGSAAIVPAVVVPAGGQVGTSIALPAGLLRGQGFAAQAVVWDGVALALGAPVAFAVQ